jgi:hypothetical protein
MIREVAGSMETSAHIFACGTTWKAVFFVLFNYLPSTIGNCGYGIEIFKPALVLYGSYLLFNLFSCI